MVGYPAMQLIASIRVRSVMRLAAPVLALLLLGCAGRRPLTNLARSEPIFSPEVFFSGSTLGSGELKIDLSRTRAVAVHGSGHLEPDGTLVLDQIVNVAGANPAKRQWRIKQTAPRRYAGSLTDASGQVVGEVIGNQLHLSYRLLKGGLAADQRIYLVAGGETALNHMTFSKLGVVVAVLDETIRRVRCAAPSC